MLLHDFYPLFLDLLLKHGNPERALRRMNELGVLGAFIPDFERIVALMQFNMYHHFTVDEHTIQCIGHLAGIERGELAADLDIRLLVDLLMSPFVYRRVIGQSPARRTDIEAVVDVVLAGFGQSPTSERNDIALST